MAVNDIYGNKVPEWVKQYSICIMEILIERGK